LRFYKKGEITEIVGFFFLCVYAHQLRDRISLEGLCRYLFEKGTQILKQSLQGRFTPAAVDFLKQTVSYALGRKLNLDTTGLQSAFNRILIEDATTFGLPEQFQDTYKGTGGGASKAGIKIHYCFDLLSGDIINIANKSAVYPDQTMELPALKANDLLISDLGFFGVPRLKNIIPSGARYLSRLKFDINIYELKNGEYKKFDLIEEEKKLKFNEIREYNLYMGKHEKLSVRIILEKVPEKVAAEKRRKLKGHKLNKKRVVSERRLKLCSLNAYVTNATSEELPKEEVRKYYSLRWQIEILFKAWKTLYKIDEVKSMKQERFECMHYGALILIILTTQMFVLYKNELYKQTKIEISEFKFFACIKETLHLLINSICSKQKLKRYLDMVWEMVLITGQKDQKIYKQSPFTILKITS
jgi:hypothetical protein